MIEKTSIVTTSEKPIIISMGKIEDWPITSLRKTCKKNKISGYTKMNKEQLVNEVRKILQSISAK